jgi:DNA-binding beta-propeller fold protein YncE
VFASTGLKRPAGLAFDNGGNLYVSEHSTGNNAIERFTPAGVGSLFASSGLDFPNGLAFDSAGNLFVANRAPTHLFGTIEKFTPGGTGSLFDGAAYAPTGLAFDTAGNLYAASGSLDNMIEEYTANGRSVFADALDGLDHHTGLAFDSVGNLYVSNWLYTIQRITPDGVGSLFADGLNNSLGLIAFTDDNGAPLLQPGGKLIPEPASGILMALGALFLGARRPRA